MVGPMKGNIQGGEIIPFRVTDLKLRNVFYTQHKFGIYNSIPFKPECFLCSF